MELYSINAKHYEVTSMIRDGFNLILESVIVYANDESDAKAKAANGRQVASQYANEHNPIPTRVNMN